METKEMTSVKQAFRPYTFEELQTEMAKGKIAVKQQGSKSIYTITHVCDGYKIQLSAYWKISYEQLLENYQWLDGSPCGVLIKQ